MEKSSQLLSAPIIRNHSYGIDFLRGVLAIWVVVAHLVPWAHHVDNQFENDFLKKLSFMLIKVFQSAGETHPAVLGFIVLSGYCIHRSGARGTHKFDLVKYAIRRSFRIYPVYLLAALLGVVLFFLSNEISTAIAGSLTGTAVISLSCVLVKLVGLSAFIPSLHHCSFQGNAPLTTVMVEIWLYIAYGFIVFLLQKGIPEGRIKTMVFMLYFISLIVTNFYPEIRGWWHNGSIFSFLIYWWIGAYFIRQNQIEPMRLYMILGAWITLTAVIIYLKIDSIFLTEIRKLLFCILFGVIIKWLDDNRRWWHSLGRHIGSAGYSIYALHAPVLIYTLMAWKSPQLSLVVLLITSAVSYKFFEKPLTKLGRSMSH
ncbi:acyltransferase family protein [Hydrogenophaga sp.]|uniref:acyltransferase family protein n=1 Tax=Hydrogenophaga sp. TaxID=1904254 RepID=UPI0035AFA49A